MLPGEIGDDEIRSANAFRDYLGHVAEEMTKQYVDYMPKKIEKANDKYFDKPENNIALTITPKKRRYRHEKG